MIDLSNCVVLQGAMEYIIPTSTTMEELTIEQVDNAARPDLQPPSGCISNKSPPNRTRLGRPTQTRTNGHAIREPPTCRTNSSRSIAVLEGWCDPALSTYVLKGDRGTWLKMKGLWERFSDARVPTDARARAGLCMVSHSRLSLHLPAKCSFQRYLGPPKVDELLPETSSICFDKHDASGTLNIY